MKVIDAHDLKSIDTKLAALRDLEKNQSQALKKTQDSICEWKEKRSSVGKHGIVVSEHAMIRYLQRVKGMDLEGLAKDICGGSDPKTIISPTNGTYPIGDHIIKIKDGAIVTVLKRKNA